MRCLMRRRFTCTADAQSASPPFRRILTTFICRRGVDISRFRHAGDDGFFDIIDDVVFASRYEFRFLFAQL